MGKTDDLKARLEAAEKKHKAKSVAAKQAEIEQKRERVAKARDMVRSYENAVGRLQNLGGTIDSLGGRSHPEVSDVMVMNLSFVTKFARVNFSLEHQAGEVVATCYPGEEQQRLKVDDTLDSKLAETVVQMLERAADL